MNSTTSATTPAPSPSFVPFDFLPQFVAGINDGVVFQISDGSPILSTITEESAISPARVHEALEVVAGYFKPPGLSAEMDVNRVQQFAVFLAEILNHQHRNQGGATAQLTAYELGNAVAALQKVLGPQTPTGRN